MLSFELVGCGSPDFIGLRDNCFSRLFGGLFVAILFSVDHHLGDSRKSAHEVGASRLFCFTAGFSGSPNGCSFQAGRRCSVPVHRSTVTKKSKAQRRTSKVRIAEVHSMEVGSKEVCTCQVCSI